MKLLRDILYKVSLEEVIGQTNMAITSIAFDSRKVEPHGLFVAVSGTQVDGHDFIETAVEKGAIAIVCEHLPEAIKDEVTYLKVNNSHEALGYLAANFYDNPSSEIKLIGVTGTNGKTTVTTLLYKLFQNLDKKSGLLSTVKIMVGKDQFKATHTTPDQLTINKYLRQMVDAGCKFAFMEVSSHGIDQERIAGLTFAGAVFTNITHDHLDYHKTFKNYIRTKKRLFDGLPKQAFALLNADDKHHVVMTEHTKAKVYTFGLRNPADFKAKLIENQLDGMLLKINAHEFWTKLIGKFNAYNISAVYAVANLLDIDSLQVLTILSTMDSVEGRFQYMRAKDGTIDIVDYAHTPDALQNVLDTILDVNNGQAQVITVVGCGGDRDKTKRPEMAKIAARLSDKVLLTSDNPRTEDPNAILDDMEAGLDPTQKAKSLRITDRAQAIKAACQLAQKGDIILVAGKGHETYQEINGVRMHFNDMEELKQHFNLKV